MKQEIKDYECQYCHEIFHMTRGGFSNHLRYCKLNPNSDLNKKQLSLKQKEYLEKHKQIKNEYILYCKECGKEYKLFLTEKQYNNGKYSKFCSIFCARKHASNCASDNLKEAKCVDCGKLIYIENRASDKTCRCNDCKLIHNEPLKNVLFAEKNLDVIMQNAVQKNVHMNTDIILKNIYLKNQ